MMPEIAWIIGGAVLVVAILALVFRGRIGSAVVNLREGSVKVSESKRSTSEAVDVQAGGNIKVKNMNSGDARAERAVAGKDIEISSGPDRSDG